MQNPNILAVDQSLSHGFREIPICLQELAGDWYISATSTFGPQYHQNQQFHAEMLLEVC